MYIGILSNENGLFQRCSDLAILLKREKIKIRVAFEKIVGMRDLHGQY